MPKILLEQLEDIIKKLKTIWHCYRYVTIKAISDGDNLNNKHILQAHNFNSQYIV